MTDKELKKLKRTELLEMMLKQDEELEELRKQLQEAKEKIKNQETELQKFSSIADAALNLSGIFETAQAAADIYVENIKKSQESELVEEETETPEPEEKQGEEIPQAEGPEKVFGTNVRPVAKNNHIAGRFLKNGKLRKKRNGNYTTLWKNMH